MPFERITAAGCCPFRWHRWRPLPARLHMEYPASAWRNVSLHQPKPDTLFQMAFIRDPSYIMVHHLPAEDFIILQNEQRGEPTAPFYGMTHTLTVTMYIVESLLSPWIYILWIRAFCSRRDTFKICFVLWDIIICLKIQPTYTDFSPKWRNLSTTGPDYTRFFLTFFVFAHYMWALKHQR